MALGLNVRKFQFQAAAGNIWEVILTEATSGAVSGIGRRVEGDDPSFDDTEVSFVVITTKVDKVFGTGAQLDTTLAHAAYYDASNVGGAGAALSTLLT